MTIGEPGWHELELEVVAPATGWEMEPAMPESARHAAMVTRLVANLVAWADRARRPARVVRNLRLRWHERRPELGVNPDIALFAPPPTALELGEDLRTWLPGQAPPALAVEVVSDIEPRKGYDLVAAKYACSGIAELWIFDPTLSGPRDHAGPWKLHVWRMAAVREGTFSRTHAGEGPAFSPALGARLVIDGDHLKIV